VAGRRLSLRGVLESCVLESFQDEAGPLDMDAALRRILALRMVRYPSRHHARHGRACTIGRTARTGHTAGAGRKVPHRRRADDALPARRHRVTPFRRPSGVTASRSRMRAGCVRTTRMFAVCAAAVAPLAWHGGCAVRKQGRGAPPAERARGAPFISV
jgi:hypothetical protein